MRKKLLRSRTGFEKPESREEAIMQNILGASNVLEPAESNIEEILQAILYNTPYTKEPETNIEEILLAIKNNGTYTGECKSRDMKILFAILTGSTYNEEAESRIEELFIEWLYQRSSIKVLEGVPPLTFTSRGLPLINYLIEGNTVQNGGVGVRTENLWNAEFGQGGININGNPVITSERIRAYQAVQPNTTYTVSSTKYVRLIYGYNGDEKVDVIYDLNSNLSQSVTFTTQSNCTRIGFAFAASTTATGNITPSDISEVMLNTGSTPLPYEPYGYKIPITCGGVTTDVYIGESPLYDGDTIGMADTGISIPTALGKNILTVDTTVKPSNVYIEYK